MLGVIPRTPDSPAEPLRCVQEVRPRSMTRRLILRMHRVAFLIGGFDDVARVVAAQIALAEDGQSVFGKGRMHRAPVLAVY